MKRKFVLVLFAGLVAASLSGGAAPAQAPVPAPRPAAAPAIAPRLPNAGPPAAAESAPPVDNAERLDSAKQSLDSIEKFLANESLTDAELAQQGAAIEPISKQIQNSISDIAPNLAALKTRVDQLGPAPDPKAKPPVAPEDPVIAQDRADQMKLFTAADDLLKRGNLLQVRADQLSAQIVSRRRDLFASAVFQRESSILAPALWLDLASETPRALGAVRGALADFASHVASALGGGAALPFVALLSLLAAAVAGAILVARRVLPHQGSRRAPNELQKAAAALWTLLAVTVIPFGAAAAAYALAYWFGLNDPQYQPVADALFWGVVRCALAVGLGTAILAPNRPIWRPIDLSDPVAQKLMNLILTIAVIITLGKLVEALNDVVGASLKATVATRGAFALLAGVALARGLFGIIAAPDDEEKDAHGRPAQLADEGPWWPTMRFAVWAAIAAIVGADLLGYISLASFIVSQLAWTALVLGLLFLLLKLTGEGAEQAFRPNSRFSRSLISSLGLRRERLQQVGVLLAGAAYVALCAIAALLVVTPWGVHSQDMLGAIKSAFFGVKIGDITLSMSSLILALLFFGVGFGLTRATQNWLENRYLPLTQLDMGLRNSIRTSVGYVGVLASLSFALATLGINTERLALVAGALSVGIGLGLQSVVNNFVSGLILLWERAIRVGDWILVGDDQGYVRRITVRSTEIETFDRATMIVPNGQMVSGVVKNFVRDDRVGRVKIPVSVIWGTDPEKVRETLFDAARSHDEVVGIPAPSVLFTQFSPNALDFELICFVENVERGLRVKSDLHFAIFKRFAEAGLRMNAPAAPTTLTLDLAQIEPLLKRQFAPQDDIKPGDIKT